MESEGVENVRQLSRSVVIEGLQREQLPRLTLDFDGSVQSTKGHAEGTAVGYNKKKKGAINVQRFKGLGEMNPLQLRETTMAPDTRRLVCLTLDRDDKAESMMDMLLAKKRAADRRAWLEEKGKLSIKP